MISGTTRSASSYGQRIDVDNPATGEVIGAIENMSPSQVAALTERARAAQPAWEALGFAQRAKLVRALQEWFVAEREAIVDIVVAENGKTREDALLAELFPAKIRYSSMSIPYHIGAGYFGGFLPLIANYIVAKSGDAYAGLWYTWAFVLISLLVGIWGIPSGPPQDFAEDAR